MRNIFKPKTNIKHQVRAAQYSSNGVVMQNAYDAITLIDSKGLLNDLSNVLQLLYIQIANNPRSLIEGVKVGGGYTMKLTDYNHIIIEKKGAYK